MLNQYLFILWLLAFSRFANYLRRGCGEPRFATTSPPTCQDKLQGNNKNWEDITLCGSDSTLYIRGSGEVLQQHRLPYPSISIEFRRIPCLSQKTRLLTSAGGREHPATLFSASANSLASRHQDASADLLESACSPYCKQKEIEVACANVYVLNFWNRFVKTYEHIAFDTNRCTQLYGNSFCHTTTITKSEEIGPFGNCSFAWGLQFPSAPCRKHRHGSAYDKHSDAYRWRRRQRSTETISITRQSEIWSRTTSGYFKARIQLRASCTLDCTRNYELGMLAVPQITDSEPNMCGQDLLFVSGSTSTTPSHDRMASWHEGTSNGAVRHHPSYPSSPCNAVPDNTSRRWRPEPSGPFNHPVSALPRALELASSSAQHDAEIPL